MAETVLEETNVTTTFSSEFDSISIPPPPSPFDDNFYNSSTSDHALPGNPISDLRLFIDGDGEGDFELTFNSVDDLYFPSENESFVIPVDATNREMSLSKDSDCSGTVQSLSLSTQKSEISVSEATIASSSSSSSRESVKMVIDDQRLKMEEVGTNTKRKKEIEEEEDESRNNKYRRSNDENDEEDDEKRNTRLIRNRESAQLSRQRKKHYVEELEDKVKKMQSTIMDLNSKISYFMTENAALRQQLGPRSGMYRPPMVYPWLQYCPGYMLKPQGSQLVPLLHIPRLKPQQSVAKVKGKKKTKKVASFSVLGLLLSLFLFGALAPIYDQSRGRVLDVNGSEHLLVSLFVPRNEKLVKIDGNLIIHSVLASEKAMASESKNDDEKTNLVTTKSVLHLPDFPRTGDLSKNLYSEKRKAQSSSSSDDSTKDKLKSTTANGEMQKWFHEGVAGPMFSSGMCTEVFQFDVSSLTSEAIIPTSPVTKQPKNITDTHKGKKNRRILRGGLPESDFNLTKDQNSSTKENFRETKPDPSMVVSVLVDPREDDDGMIEGTQSMSRVFIVLLVDGVKYVTYSCVLLPQPEVPHIVTT